MIADASTHERLEWIVKLHTELKQSGLWQVGKCPFPDHADTRPSFGICDGRFPCFAPSCGRRGNAIDFVRLHDGLGFVEAVHRLLGQDGIDITRTKPAPAKTHKTDNDAARTAYAVRIFNDGVPLQDTPGWVHLVRRGIDVTQLPESIHDVLRSHPQCPWESGVHGCMVALFTDAITGAQKAIHRTAITHAGEAKSLDVLHHCRNRLKVGSSNVE